MHSATTTPTSKDVPISVRAVAIWLVLFCALGLFLRIQAPYFYSYSGDEAIQANVAGGESFAQVLHFARHEANPPLLHILLHYWLKLSTNPSFARLLSLLPGLALIPLYYFIGARMGGQISGLCCAGLVALSFGGIVQSTVLRMYGILLVCLSMNLLCYLRWRDSGRLMDLFGYVVFGWLAIASHFTAALYILSIATFGLYSMRHMERKHIAWWAFANGAVTAMFAMLYLLWQPTLSFLHAHDGGIYLKNTAILTDRIVGAMATPLLAANYICPAGLLLVALAYAASGRMKKPNSSSPAIQLAVWGSLLSAGLFVTGIYPALGTRHSLWMFPLLIPAAGQMIANAIRRTVRKAGGFPIGAIIAGVAACALADMWAQLAFSGEYAYWQQGPAQDMQQALAGLKPDDVIITDRHLLDAMDNQFRFRTDPVFMNEQKPRLSPYHDTQILVSPDYFEVYDGKAVMTMVRQAEAAGLLKNTRRLVFAQFYYDLPLMRDLLSCATLVTQPIYHFDPAAKETVPASQPTGLVAIGVPKQNFLDGFVPPSGKAPGCYDESHDKPEPYMPMTARHR
ncbi:MAG: hypothetical protein HY221_01885 [Candidatus Sungbacteria bacterium]|uniref:Glycosyltransferase RgtA/B/C/D-like domain-containing protein n=1 Tax=Candidatus Sungiibacteriota bacterium TaxID=2750080 RepID=A0A932VPN5_9BACT|nr:hypothetical protein [Candidatus Sungbacteria bacterium]